MRDSEELAYEIYKASVLVGEPLAWGELPDGEQILLLNQVNAVFEWLFAHGRISQYINHEQLTEAQAEYAAYLEAPTKEQSGE